MERGKIIKKTLKYGEKRATNGGTEKKVWVSPLLGVKCLDIKMLGYLIFLFFYV